MQNEIARDKAGLLIEASSVVNGATLHGGAVQLKPGTATAIGDAITAAQDAQEELEEERAILREYYQIVFLLLPQIILFARLFRELMKKTLGARFSQAWMILGFLNNLSIPASAVRLETMIYKMWKFLQSNPQHEVTVRNVTAAEAEMLYDKISKARTDLETQQSKVTGLTQVCEAKFAALREGIRNVLGELKVRIAPLDSRWQAFGFNMPGATATPDVPENVVAILIGNNAISVKWDGAARAEHYRVWKRVVGVDDEFVAAGSPADRDFTIEGLPSAKEVEIAVSAVNNGGESQKSEVKKVTTL